MTATAGALALVAALAACGSNDSADPDVTAFQNRAGVSAATAWAAQYRLDTTGQKTAATLDVARVPDQLRLDITTASGVATNISGAQGAISCQTSPGKTAVCVQAAVPGQTPPPALDPALRSVLATTLPAIAAGRAEVDYLGPSDDAKFPDASCARVSGEGVAEGVYCLFPDGVPASANFPSGSIAFVKRLPAPETKAFDPPASPRPR
jgi:hypothetical protein